jgi:hypothetical protein
MCDENEKSSGEEVYLKQQSCISNSNQNRQDFLHLGLYDEPTLQAFSSSTSDHCPLIFTPFNTPKFKPKFRFESFWMNMPNFKEVVMEAWNRDTPHHLNHMLSFRVKLSRVAKALRFWSKSLVSHAKLAMTICRDVILQLEVAQERRPLSLGEIELIRKLKLRILGLAAVERSRERQRSRVTWLRKGDANTKYVHLMATMRKQINFIHVLLSHPVFRPNLNAFLYVCQDQVSHIKR